MADKIVLFPCTPCAPFKFRLSYDWEMTCSCKEHNTEQKGDGYKGHISNIGNSWSISSEKGACYPANPDNPCRNFGATAYYECEGIFNRLISNVKLEIDASDVATGGHKLMLRKDLFNNVYTIRNDCAEILDSSYISTTIDIIKICGSGSNTSSFPFLGENVYTLQWEVPLGKVMGVSIEYCGCGCDETITSETFRDENLS